MRRPSNRGFKEFGAGMSALRGSEVPGSLSTAQTSRVDPLSGSSRLLMASKADQGRGCSRTYPEFSVNVSLPGAGFWRMINEARS